LLGLIIAVQEERFYQEEGFFYNKSAGYRGKEREKP